MDLGPVGGDGEADPPWIDSHVEFVVDEPLCLGLAFRCGGLERAGPRERHDRSSVLVGRIRLVADPDRRGHGVAGVAPSDAEPYVVARRDVGGVRGQFERNLVALDGADLAVRDVPNRLGVGLPGGDGVVSPLAEGDDDATVVVECVVGPPGADRRLFGRRSVLVGDGERDGLAGT
jgi:hypothetical protein